MVVRLLASRTGRSLLPWKRYFISVSGTHFFPYWITRLDCEHTTMAPKIYETMGECFFAYLQPEWSAGCIAFMLSHTNITVRKYRNPGLTFVSEECGVVVQSQEVTRTYAVTLTHSATDNITINTGRVGENNGLCKIWGCHGGDYEQCTLLGYKNPVRTSKETLISPLQSSARYWYVRFEVFAVLTMKNAAFWNVTPCGSCKNRCFGRT
jgi:hypothetical protein